MRLSVFRDQESIVGKVIINIGASKTFEHKGIKLELIGLVESTTDKKISTRIISLGSDIEAIGILSKEVNNYEFKFNSVEKRFETYYGKAFNVRYILKLTIETKLKTLNYEQEFAVLNPVPIDSLKENNEQIKLEVGIDEWLHLAFVLDTRNYCLKDTAIGRITFKKVGLRLLGMEIQLIKKETSQTGTQPEPQILAQYEIMDGGPFKFETIPIRLFLKPYELTPTMSNISNRYSVQYFVNIVLTDAEERKYFKQHEIFIFRTEKPKNPSKMFANVAGSVINALPGHVYNKPQDDNNPSSEKNEQSENIAIPLD